jgi:hypothetical protein
LVQELAHGHCYTPSLLGLYLFRAFAMRFAIVLEAALATVVEPWRTEALIAANRGAAEAADAAGGGSGETRRAALIAASIAMQPFLCHVVSLQ